MNGHPTNDDLLQFLRGGLAKGRVIEIGEHVETCPLCAASASGRHVAALARALDPLSDEHPPQETLTSYVDGTLARPDAETVEAHLESCKTCREDVEDLRQLATLLSRDRWPRRAFLAVAAAAMIVVLTVFAIRATRRESPAPETPLPVARSVPAAAVQPGRTVARTDWSAAVAEALREGSIAMPAALAELQREADPERAPSEGRSVRMAPTGQIIETTRPVFTWTPIERGSYIVSVFDGQELAVESPTLHQPRWQVSRDLPRGRTYQWQVAARDGDLDTILPTPPATPAVFRVLDAAAHQELENARAAHGADPLLLGVLYAQKGLRAEAERELSRLNTPEARRLLRSVQSWGRP